MTKIFMHDETDTGIQINSVLRANPDSKTYFKGFARLVKVNEDNLAALVLLDVFDKDRFNVNKLKGIFYVSVPGLLAEIETKNILTDQIFDCGVRVSVEQFSNKEKEEFYKRIELKNDDLLNDDAIIFDPKLRGQRFKEVAKKYGESPRTIRRIYYLYLWGGQTDNALSPRLYLRGGPNKPQKTGTGRRGRKDYKHADSSEVILPDVREALEKGARQLYLPGTFTLEESYVITKERYFSKGARLNTSGTLEEILLPPAQLPSPKQFRYVCEQVELKEGKRRKLPRQVRKRKQKWEFRGKSRAKVFGPGYRFEIDPSKMQIELVSRLGRGRPIGNATFYIIVDLFSGAYTGYSISLKNESWDLASTALVNCFQEKRFLFERLKYIYDRNGIPCTYTNDDWPCHHLPARLTTDRGPLTGDKALQIPKAGIKFEFTPSGCPERKGKVEAAIKEAKHHNFYKIPGKYPKFLKRREASGKKTAALTLDELELLLVEIIMDLNNEPVPQENIPLQMLETGETDITHIGVYKWGLKHCPGFTRQLDAKEVYTHFWTKGEAHVTPRGISFEKCNFVSDHLFDSSYTMKAANDGDYPIEIRFNGLNADKILYLDAERNDWIIADNDNEEIRRIKASFLEWEMYQDELADLSRHQREENIHKKYHKAINHIGPMIRNAIKEARLARRAKTLIDKFRNTRENRQTEIEVSQTLDEYRSKSYMDQILRERESKDSRSETNTIPPTGAETEPIPTIAQRAEELWRKKK